jgi:DNA-binding NarL/FixJ family response regulator
MPDKKIFTYVTTKTTTQVESGPCSQLPIILKTTDSIESLFPLLSDPSYHTDFVVICADLFYHREDKLNMFELMNTLGILIRSTVHRLEKSGKPKRRDTKIIILANQNTEPSLIKELMKFPIVVSISWTLDDPGDFESVGEHLDKILAGDYTNHPKVTQLIKPKKKLTVTKSTIKLTPRQTQIHELIVERGASNKTIANMLGICESTVKLHIGTILKKFGAKNRTQLVCFSRVTEK